VVTSCGSDGYFLYPLEDDEGVQGYSFRCNCGYESPDWFPQTADAKYYMDIHQSGGNEHDDSNEENSSEEDADRRS